MSIMSSKGLLAVALCVAGFAVRAVEADGASGFFRVRQKENGVWTFVDPEGNDVFLRAVDQAGWTDGALKRAEEAGNPIDFAEVRSNLIAWGFNTQGTRAGNERKPTVPDFPWYFHLKLGSDVGATEDPERGLTLNRHVPGTAFPNVFRPGFEEDVFRVAQERCAPHRDDPLLVGYCIDNELAFNGRNRGISGHWGLFEAARLKPVTNSAHVALMDFLRSHGIDSAENVPMEVREDFCRLVARRYFDVTTRAIRAADPNHLVLGSRFANHYDWTDEEAGKFVDVLSFNCYPCVDLDRESLDPAVARAFRELYSRSGRPLLVTEWSFPAVDVGYETAGPGSGQRFATQAQRARATEIFARTMAAMPFVAGYSYFMYRDPPAKSREETNYGLVDRDGKPFPEITSMFARLQSTEGIAFARPDGVAFSRNGDKWRLEAVGGLVLSGVIGRRELCRIAYKGEDFGYATAGMMLDKDGVEDPKMRQGFRADYPMLERISDVHFETKWEYRRSVLITGEGSSGDQRFEMEVRVTLLDAADRLRFEIVSIRNVGAVPLLGARAMLRHFTPFREIVKSGRNIADKGIRDRVIWGKPSVAEIRSVDGSLSLECSSGAKPLVGINFSLDSSGNLHPDVYFAPWFEPSRGRFGEWDSLLLAPGEAWRPADPAYDEIRLRVGKSSPGGK